MTDLVARLRAAIDETERIAQRTLNGPFEGMRAGVFTDHHESPPVQGAIVRISMLPMSWAEGPFAPIYIAYDPAVVLRRCAADRRILDLWDANEQRRAENSANFRRLMNKPFDDTEATRDLPTVKTHSSKLEGRREALHVVLEALAEAYGVEA